MILVLMAAESPITTILCDSAVHRKQNQNNNYARVCSSYLHVTFNVWIGVAWLFNNKFTGELV